MLSGAVPYKHHESECVFLGVDRERYGSILVLCYVVFVACRHPLTLHGRISSSSQVCAMSVGALFTPSSPLWSQHVQQS